MIMFDRNELYRVYKFNVSIFDILGPYWNLYVRIKGIEILNTLTFPDGYESYKLECSHLYERFQKDIIDVKDIEEKESIIEDIKNSIINKVLNELTKYVTESMYKNERFYEPLRKKVIAIFFDKDSLVCVTKECNEEKLKLILEKSLRRANPILSLLKVIDNGDDNTLRDMVNIGLYEIAADKTINDVDLRSMYAPIYHLSDFSVNEDELHTCELNSSDYWINDKLFKEILEIEECNINRVIAFSKNESNSVSNMHGIILDNYLIPLINDFKKEYTGSINAFWRELKFGVYHHKSDKDGVYKLNPIQQQFLTAAKNETVTNKLSFLVDNLYVPQENIAQVDGIECFFNDVTIIDNLSELENYEFFASDGMNQEGPFIGIHKKDKAGSQSYKLLHYICKKGSNFVNTRGIEKTSSLKKAKVKILKPELSFYYLLRYFEDFVAMALDEIKNEGLNIDFITNQRVSIDSNNFEIDIMAFNGKNVYIIELKTNLSLDYIVAYQKKCNKWISFNKDNPQNIKFVILGSFAKETLKICNGKNDDRGEYNGTRPGMFGNVHSFSVELDNDNELLCFTESSFQRLKKKLLNILISNEATSN